MFINPTKGNDRAALEAVSSLTQKVSMALSGVLADAFPKVNGDVCDSVRTEWRMYQTENIPESHLT